MYTLTDNLVTRVFDNWAFFVGPLLTIPLLFSLSRPRRSRCDLLTRLAVLLVATLFQLLLYPYHLAPLVPILFCLIAAGCENIYDRLSLFACGSHFYFAAALLWALVGVTAIKQCSAALDIPESSYWERGYEWYRNVRAQIVRWLQRRPAKHIVLVRYAPGHPVNQEWVYNGADLQNSNIIWARETGDESDLQLLEHYSDRHAWLLEADVYPQRVVPYPVADATAIRAGTDSLGYVRQ